MFLIITNCDTIGIIMQKLIALLIVKTIVFLHLIPFL